MRQRRKQTAATAPSRALDQAQVSLKGHGAVGVNETAKASEDEEEQEGQLNGGAAQESLSSFHADASLAGSAAADGRSRDGGNGGAKGGNEVEEAVSTRPLEDASIITLDTPMDPEVVRIVDAADASDISTLVDSVMQIAEVCSVG